MEKLNKLGYTKIELMIVIVLLGVVAFITINTTSYAFTIDKSGSANDVKNIIEKQAEDYAKDNLSIFDETNVTFISVNDLVEAKYMLGNDHGLVTDPADTSKSYNSNKIKLTYDKDKDLVEAIFID